MDAGDREALPEEEVVQLVRALLGLNKHEGATGLENENLSTTTTQELSSFDMRELRMLLSKKDEKIARARAFKILPPLLRSCH